MNNKPCILFLLLLLATQAYAQPAGFTKLESIETVKAKMKKLGESQQSISSTFTQVKKMEYLDIAIKSQGDFWYAAPANVRWEYTTPYEYIIIINNGKLSLISGDNQNDFNLENSEMFEQINALMVGTVTGNIFNSSDYNVEVFESSGLYLFNIKPKASFMDGVLTGIDMFLEKESGKVTKIKMIETPENYTEISFANIKLNEAIPEGIFVP